MRNAKPPHHSPDTQHTDPKLTCFQGRLSGERHCEYHLDSLGPIDELTSLSMQDTDRQLTTRRQITTQRPTTSFSHTLNCCYAYTFHNDSPTQGKLFWTFFVLLIGAFAPPALVRSFDAGNRKRLSCLSVLSCLNEPKNLEWYKYVLGSPFDSWVFIHITTEKVHTICSLCSNTQSWPWRPCSALRLYASLCILISMAPCLYPRYGVS
jgi:hypothetical protein